MSTNWDQKLTVPGMRQRRAEDSANAQRAPTGTTNLPLEASPVISEATGATGKRTKELIPRTPSPVYHYGEVSDVAMRPQPRFFPFAEADGQTKGQYAPTVSHVSTTATQGVAQIDTASGAAASQVSHNAAGGMYFNAVGGGDGFFNNLPADLNPQMLQGTISNSGQNPNVFWYGDASAMTEPNFATPGNPGAPPAWIGPGQAQRAAGNGAVVPGATGSALLNQIRSRVAGVGTVKLSDVAQDAVEFAQDQFGSRFLQQSLETSTLEERHAVFLAILPYTTRLTTDAFGNYVVQKLIDYLPEEHRRILAEQLLGDVLRHSLHMYGCRVIQKIMEGVGTEQQILLSVELQGHVVRCVEDQNGNHVIQKCIEKLPPESIDFIVNEFKSNVERMSLHCYGCRVVQRLIEKCPPSMSRVLVAEVLASLQVLVQDQYGNYVVQHVLQHFEEERQPIMELVCGNLLEFSSHKFASNVVEKALIFGSAIDRERIIGVAIGDCTENCPMVVLTKDRFANYVCQRILEYSGGTQRENLITLLQPHVAALRKVTYGKHIASTLDKIMGIHSMQSQEIYREQNPVVSGLIPGGGMGMGMLSLQPVPIQHQTAHGGRGGRGGRRP